MTEKNAPQPRWIRNLRRELVHAIPIDPQGRFSHQITENLTNATQRWGIAQGCNCKKEFSAPWLQAYTRTGTPKNGRIDVVLSTPRGGKLAVEIDRGEKTWSLEKLLLCRERGYQAVWIKWGKPIEKKRLGFAETLSQCVQAGVYIIEIPIQQTRSIKNGAEAIKTHCPRCSAGPGALCRSGMGQERVHFHRERRMV